MGIRVTVLASNVDRRYPKLETFENIEIMRFFSLAPNESYYFTPGIFNHLRKVRAANTVVHAHNYQALPAIAAALAKRYNRLPLVTTPHYHPYGGTRFRTILKALYRPLGRAVFDSSDIVIALSEFEKVILERVFNIGSSRIRVVPPGSSPFNHRRPVRPSKTILYVGRLERYKGVDFLLNCMPMVLREVPTARLLIVGRGPDEARLKKLMVEKSLCNSVQFLGRISSEMLEQLYCDAGVLVLTSEYEAHSLVVGEALARGIPVVATRVGAVAEIYGDQPGCFLLEYPPKSDEVAQTIIKILSSWGYPQHTRRKSRSSYLSWSEVANMLVHIYTKVL